MNKPLLFALSALVFGLNGLTQVVANCGSCEGDAVATTQVEAPAKAEAKASSDSSLADRVSSLEQSLKDVGSCEAAGTPFPSKAQGSKAVVCPYTQKSSECPMAKCPNQKCDKAKTCPKDEAKSSEAS